MTPPSIKVQTSPCKGEVDREASGRRSRLSRIRSMTVRAKKLRLNMTDAESRLWRVLRHGKLNQLHFRNERRTRFLAEKNIGVVRDWTNDVLGNLQGVLVDLVAITERRALEVTPSPTLPLPGGGSSATSHHDGGAR